MKHYEKLFDEEEEEEDFYYEDDENDDDDVNSEKNTKWPNSNSEEFEDDDDEVNDNYDEENDDDDDDEELKEQLDMHSMILSKCDFNDDDLDEPIITAEQVLDEIDSMMTMQVGIRFKINHLHANNFLKLNNF